MSRSVRLGSAFGVEIAADSSSVFALILATWTLASLAGHALPKSSSAAATLVGFCAAIGVFASLAVHEIAHGVAVRACGVPVHEITLFVFGGVTDVECAPASPRSETLAAALAPMANAVIGLALLAGAAAMGPGANALGTLVRWLGAANLAIAALNVLPAFPLDGGRLLRAAIWRATGDIERATRWSAWAAETIGWSIVVAGVILVFVSHGDRVAAAMWIAFVGWFLTSAAAQAYARVRTGDHARPNSRWHQRVRES